MFDVIQGQAAEVNETSIGAIEPDIIEVDLDLVWR